MCVEVEDEISGTGRVDDLDRGGLAAADKQGWCRFDAEIVVVVIVDRCPTVCVDVFVAVADVLGNGGLDPNDLEGALTGCSPVLMFDWRGVGMTDGASVDTRSDQISAPPLNSRTV